MVSKLIGYAIALVGVVGIAIPLVPKIKSYIPIPETIPSIYITIGSLGLVGLGLAITRTSKGRERTGKQQKEVPIYDGKHIVGYRRN